MKTNEFVVWKDVPVKIVTKYFNSKIGVYFGAIPVVTLKIVDDKPVAEPVDNRRGLAYAKRRDLRFRKNHRYVPPVTED